MSGSGLHLFSKQGASGTRRSSHTCASARDHRPLMIGESNQMTQMCITQYPVDKPIVKNVMRIWTRPKPVTSAKSTGHTCMLYLARFLHEARVVHTLEEPEGPMKFRNITGTGCLDTPKRPGERGERNVRSQEQLHRSRLISMVCLLPTWCKRSIFCVMMLSLRPSRAIFRCSAESTNHDSHKG
jgi:hypothetical protein